MVIPTVVGMMGPSVSSLRSMFKALISTEPWLHDPDVLPLPYRSDAECDPQKTPKLSFGIFEYYNNTLNLQDFRTRYQEYWTSTASKTGTGQHRALVIEA